MSIKKQETKKGSKFVKILILVVILAFVAVGSVIISDLFFSDNTNTPEIETVTITVSGTDIYLNGSEKMSIDALDTYFANRYAENNYCTIALINDTKHPADVDTYNDVVELLGEYGIRQEKLTLPATYDKLKSASSDEN